MNPENLDRQIETAQECLDALRQIAEEDPESGEALQEAVERFAVVLEELYVVQEELRQQHDELLFAHQTTQAERMRYQELFDLAPDAYFVTDTLGVIREANRAVTALLNVPGEFLIGKPLAVFVPGEDGSAFDNLLGRLEAGDEIGRKEWELHLQPRNGPPVPVALTASPAHDADDHVTGVRWLVRDLTPTRRAEERERLLVQIQRDKQAIGELAADLERERDILETIMENTHAQLAYLDRDFYFLRVNSAYAQGVGYAKEELIGRNHFELFPSGENQAIFEDVRDTGRPAQYHAKPLQHLDRPERGITYWDWTLVPVKDARGRVRGLVFSLLDVTEAQQAHQELERLAARDRAILESMTEGLIMFDLGGNILSMNPAALRIHGFERVEEARRHPFGYPDVFRISTLEGELLPIEEWPASRVLRGERFTDFELRVRRTDRDHMFVGRYGGSLVFDKEGRRMLGILTLHDITAEKAAEAERARIRQALARYAERLRIMHDIDQAILAARSVEEIAQGVLSHVRQLVPCRRTSVAVFDQEAGEAHLLAVGVDGSTRLEKGWRGPLEPDWPIHELAGGQVCVVEDADSVPVSKPLGQILREEGVRAYVNVPLLAQGQLIGALNLALDHPGELVTEQMDVVREMAAELAIGIQQMRLNDQVQRHAQELEDVVVRRTAALQASEARLRTIFEGAAIGIALADMEGRVLETNPALEKMLGYSPQGLVGKTFTEFTFPDDARVDMELFREMMPGNRDEYKLEKRYVRKDGQVIWGNLTVSLVRNSAGEPLYAVGMVEDVTERKQIQEALLNAEKLAIAGRMGASLAHEINNPLQSVIGCLGLAEKNLPEGADAGRYLGVARQELRRAARIVSQLRDMSRPAEEEKKKGVDLNALVDEVLVLSRKQAQERRVEVTWEPAKSLPSIQTAPDRLRQVFLNLALNALDAMPEGGALRVSTVRSVSPAGVQVAFTDSGTGMTSDALSRLFDPFYTTKSQGLGLGLYISHNIVEEHGGHIDVASRIGEGTTFTVWLPADAKGEK